MIWRSMYHKKSPFLVLLCLLVVPDAEGFTGLDTAVARSSRLQMWRSSQNEQQLQQQQHPSINSNLQLMNPADWSWTKLSQAAAVGFLSATLSLLPFSSHAENELSAKYGGSLDTSLVDQSCLVNHCSLQAKTCLQDDPSCRKGLTCTAKCLGDNACITGCMARYGNTHLDDLLKCTIEDHECIQVAILDGGADPYGQEPKSIAPTVRNFDYKSLEGSWFKVVGYNPNYDCYACQRNSFTIPSATSTSDSDRSIGFLPKFWETSSTSSTPRTLQMDVEFSMLRLLPDGSPVPPSGRVRESVLRDPRDGSLSSRLQSMALNDYRTHEIMIFDDPENNDNDNNNPLQRLILNRGTDQEVSYSRTAHSEGEMFGLKFWENWYVIGENDPGQQEFKFIYYNGKTRQNTYEGAFVYSRTKELDEVSMRKVYQIAVSAGMNPDQFCRIRNGCFSDPVDSTRKIENNGGILSDPFLRGILASTKISQLLGVEPVAARDTIRVDAPTARILQPLQEQPEDSSRLGNRRWWHEIGDYLENPHRHFRAMDELRLKVDWPKDVAVSQ